MAVTISPSSKPTSAERPSCARSVHRPLSWLKWNISSTRRRPRNAPYAAGKKVVLFAIPGLGSRPLGWSGACSGTTFYCRLRMDDVKAVGATFTRR